VDRFGTFDAQALTPHGLKVLASGDEVHICTPFAQAGTEIAAKSARTHERYAHARHLPLALVCGTLAASVAPYLAQDAQRLSSAVAVSHPLE
jgi:hypothetical protein